MGEEQEKQKKAIQVGVVSLSLLAAVWWLWPSNKTPEAAAPAQQEAPRPPPKPTPLETSLAAMTPEEDAEREKLVVMAQKSGWLGEVNWALHRAVVGPGFKDLDFKMKEGVAWSVVLVGLRREGAKKGTFLGANYNLELLDPKTNKRLGTYSTLWGKLTME